MIRKCTPDDLDAVLQIWLETNIAAHSFIPESYWRGNLEAVRFYRAAGFSVRAAGVDDATGAREYEMVWPA